MAESARRTIPRDCGAVFYHNVKQTVSNIYATNSGLTFGAGGVLDGRWRYAARGGSDDVNLRVDPLVDAGLQVPRDRRTIIRIPIGRTRHDSWRNVRGAREVSVCW